MTHDRIFWCLFVSAPYSCLPPYTRSAILRPAADPQTFLRLLDTDSHLRNVAVWLGAVARLAKSLQVKNTVFFRKEAGGDPHPGFFRLFPGVSTIDLSVMDNA